MLLWLGFTLEDSLLVLKTPRGRVLLDIDATPHPTRTALLAIAAKVIL